MKKLILLFALLLPMSAFGDYGKGAQRIHAVHNQIFTQTGELFKLTSELMKNRDVDAPMGLKAYDMAGSAMGVLQMLVYHRGTVVSSKAKNLTSYKAAHQYAEGVIGELPSQILSMTVASKSAALVAELRELRKLLQQAEVVLLQTRLRPW